MRRKILVVDGDSANRELVRISLIGFGYDGDCIVQAGNDKETFDIIDGGFTPEVIISDIKAGTEIAERLFARQVDIPILLICDKAPQDVLDLVGSFGGLHRLMKRPFSREKLRPILEHIVRSLPEPIQQPTAATG